MNVWNKMTVTSVCGAFTTLSHKGRHLQMSNRINYGLSFCTDDGQITYKMNDKEFVSNHSHVILLPKGGNYSLYGDKTGEFPLINFECTDDINIAELILCPIQNPESYIRDFYRICSLGSFENNRAKTLSILYDMFSRIANENDIQYNNSLTPAMSYLHSHFSECTLSIQEIAKQANMSEQYFRRLFKEAYGISPKQYLIDLRINQAKQMLLESAESVTYIAEKCGFSSVYYFVVFSNR